MSTKLRYNKEYAPKIGVVSNSIDAFNNKAKEIVEGQFKFLFENLKQENIIAKESIYYKKRIFSPHEAYRVARLFGKEQVEAIIILNSAFPNGHVFTSIVNDPYLTKIPLIITAPPEIDLDIPEWVSNAWCGVIMNNYVAKQTGRYVYPLAGFPKNKQYQEELKKVLNVVQTVTLMRREFIGRFGEAPGGFHSAGGDRLAYLSLFGVRVETVDLTAVMNTHKTGIAKGYKGETKFSETDVKKTLKEMKKGRVVLIKDIYLEKASRLYHSLKAIIEANGFTSIAYRCWPEMNEEYIGVTPCLALTWLLSKGVVIAASCESDWPTGVAQSIGTHLSGKPTALLDFVNYTGGDEIVQLGHCGVGIAGLMAPNGPALMKEVSCNGKVSKELEKKILSGKIKVNDALAEHSVLRQAGVRIGPMYIGQFQYGMKTGINLMQDKNGKFKMLVFTGENDKKTAKGILYSAADIRVKNYKGLNELILKHGFSHHLAVAMGDISKELSILCDYYGIEYISPE